MNFMSPAEIRLIYDAVRYYQCNRMGKEDECKEILKKISPALNLYGNRPPCD